MAKKKKGKKKKKKKGMTDFQKRLAKGKEAWKKSLKGLPTVPPGTYHLKLTEANTVESKTSKKLMIARVHQVMEGEHEGETVRDFLMLQTDNAGFFVGRWIENMGYEAPEDPEDAPEIAAAIAAETPELMGNVTASTGGFTNVRFVELLEGGEIVTDDVEEEEEEDDDEGEEEEDSDDDEEEEEEEEEDESEDEDEEEDEEEEEEEDDEEEEEDDEEEEEEESDEDEQLKTDLLTFIQAQGIDEDDKIDDDADVETLKAAVLAYKYAKNEVTKDETKLLKSIGAKFLNPKKDKKKKAKPSSKKKGKKAGSKKKKKGKSKKKGKKKK